MQVKIIPSSCPLQYFCLYLHTFKFRPIWNFMSYYNSLSLSLYLSLLLPPNHDVPSTPLPYLNALLLFLFLTISIFIYFERSTVAAVAAVGKWLQCYTHTPTPTHTHTTGLPSTRAQRHRRHLLMQNLFIENLFRQFSTQK